MYSNGCFELAVVGAVTMIRQTKLSFCGPPPKQQQMNCSRVESLGNDEAEALSPISQMDTATSRAASTSICHEGDLGVKIGRVSELSDSDKFALIKDPYVPPSNYTFPKHVEHGKQRCFQQSWLTKLPWLVYSRHIDGGLCLPCVLFRKVCLLTGCLLKNLCPGSPRLVIRLKNIATNELTL